MRPRERDERMSRRGTDRAGEQSGKRDGAKCASII